MFISMVRSKKCKQKRSVPMIWKMPSRILIKKNTQIGQEKYKNVKLVDRYASFDILKI